MKRDLYRWFDLMFKKGWVARLSLSEVLVAFALAWRYNWRQGAAWPSLRLLAHDTGLARSTVCEAVRRLVTFGLWIVDRAPGRVSRYRIPDLVPDLPPEFRLPRGLRSRIVRTVFEEGGRPVRQLPDHPPSDSCRTRNYVLELRFEQ